jgi:hypothetical protein
VRGADAVNLDPHAVDVDFDGGERGRSADFLGADVIDSKKNVVRRKASSLTLRDTSRRSYHLGQSIPLERG